MRWRGYNDTSGSGCFKGRTARASTVHRNCRSIISALGCSLGECLPTIQELISELQVVQRKDNGRVILLLRVPYGMLTNITSSTLPRISRSGARELSYLPRILLPHCESLDGRSALTGGPWYDRINYLVFHTRVRINSLRFRAPPQYLSGPTTA